MVRALDTIMSSLATRAPVIPTVAFSPAAGDAWCTSRLSSPRPERGNNRMPADGSGFLPPLGQCGQDLADRAAAAGEERDLLADVPAGAGPAQVTHQVHDPVQFVGLEREYPLVIVQPERGHRVRPDVRVAAGHPAVLGQQLAALGAGQQVPLV